jgi:predicted enzyme related to lactoylglutathione lyase
VKLIGFYILSKNVSKMVDFYKKVLRAETDGEGCHVVINLPDGKGGFPIWDNGKVPDTINEKMVTWFAVDNVDDEYELLLKMNVPVIEPPVDNPWGGRHMIFCDPDGNRIFFVAPLNKQA